MLQGWPNKPSNYVWRLASSAHIFKTPEPISMIFGMHRAYAYFSVITARCTTVQSTVLRSHIICLSVCPSVTLVDDDHISWKSCKLILRTISPTSSLFVAQRSSTYSAGKMENFWGENVCSRPTTITSGWIQSRDLRWKCGCLFTFGGASYGHLCDSTAFLFLYSKHIYSLHIRHVRRNKNHTNWSIRFESMSSQSSGWPMTCISCSVDVTL